MALTTAQIGTNAQTALDAVVKGQSYFQNYLTVSTFGGDYMFQRLRSLNVAFTAIKADVALATPNTADVTVRVAAAATLINELQSYYQNFLTVSTFGGNHLFQILKTIKTVVTTLQAG